MDIRSFQFPNLKRKINFDHKLYFLYFLIPGTKREEKDTEIRC